MIIPALQFKQLSWRELLGQVQKLSWRELFGQVQRVVLARAIRSSSKSCFDASYLVGFKHLRANWSSSKSSFGASYLVEFNKPIWRKLSGRVLCFGASYLGRVHRAALARATWSSSKSCLNASYLVEFKELL